MRTAAFLLSLAFAGGVHADESKVMPLKEGPGRDKAQACVACHSLDYIHMNSRFLDEAGWAASVKKMINVFGAPIAPEDVDAIAAYLAHNYGRGSAK